MIHLVERRISRCLNAIRTQPLSFFFFNDTATTEIYTLSLHDALPIFFRFGATIGLGFHLALVVLALGNPRAVGATFTSPLCLDRLAGRRLLGYFGLLGRLDRKSTRLNSSHSQISNAVFCLKKIRTNHK